MTGDKGVEWLTDMCNISAQRVVFMLTGKVVTIVIVQRKGRLNRMGLVWGYRTLGLVTCGPKVDSQER